MVTFDLISIFNILYSIINKIYVIIYLLCLKSLEELTEVILSDAESPHRLFVHQSILQDSNLHNTDRNKLVKKKESAGIIII